MTPQFKMVTCKVCRGIADGARPCTYCHGTGKVQERVLASTQGVFFRGALTKRKTQNTEE